MKPGAIGLRAARAQVLPGALEVIGFIDHWRRERPDIAANPGLKRARFGGTIAPMVRIALDGASSRIVAGDA